MSSLTFGFQDDGQLRSGNYGSLQQGRAMGGRALRLIISRERVQRGRGAYDFSVFDNIVNRARQLGIHPQIVLDNQEGFKSGMGDPAKYEHFVKAAATHFKGRVGTYSLVNEPDLKMNPDKYRQLFVRGQRALASRDNQARVLFGEFSPHGGMDYAQRVLRKGGLHASGLAIHPYQANDPMAPPGAGGYKWGIGRTNTMQRDLRGMNLKTRAGKTPGLYFTEFGYDNGNPGGPTFWPRAIKKARDAGVREMIAYTLSPSPGINSVTGKPNWDTGIVGRPAYDQVKSAVRKYAR